MRRITAVVLAIMLMLSMFIVNDNHETNAQAVAVGGEYSFYPWVTAEGSVYNPFASISIGDNPQIVTDSNNNPHIVWEGIIDGNREIIYLRWDGSNWVTAHGTIFTRGSSIGNITQNTGYSQYPKITLDSNDNPHVTWQDSTPGNLDIYYIHWSGSNWVCADGSIYDGSNTSISNAANVSKNVGSSGRVSLTLYQNNPHLAWIDKTNRSSSSVNYAFWNTTTSSWCVRNTGIGVSDYDSAGNNSFIFGRNSKSVEVVVDSKGVVYLMWLAESGYNHYYSIYQLHLVYWSNTDWFDRRGDVFEKYALSIWHD